MLMAEGMKNTSHVRVYVCMCVCVYVCMCVCVLLIYPVLNQRAPDIRPPKHLNTKTPLSQPKKGLQGYTYRTITILVDLLGLLQ
jgi:hypothetical protein